MEVGMRLVARGLLPSECDGHVVLELSSRACSPNLVAQRTPARPYREHPVSPANGPRMPQDEPPGIRSVLLGMFQEAPRATQASRRPKVGTDQGAVGKGRGSLLILIELTL